MAEFSIIERYCTNLGAEHRDTVLAVGDDAAIMSVPDGFELTVSVDTMVEGTHFFAGLSPELIAHKMLAVNLSDMAAMGAKPRWATMATCMPDMDEDWVARFSATLGQVAKRYGVQIVGGDTTEGPRVLSLTIMGLLPKGQSMRRDGARVGDKLYCSGVIGDAGLALTKLHGEQEVPDDIFKEVLPALHMPQPQVALGQRLLGHVNACLDLSDGLVGDSAHIAKSSNVSIEIDVDSIPLSEAYQRYLANGGFMKYAVAGGDDYQLLFTADEDKAEFLETVARDMDIKITEIGKVVAAGTDLVTVLKDGKPAGVRYKAYQHFT